MGMEPLHSTHLHPDTRAVCTGLRTEDRCLARPGSAYILSHGANCRETSREDAQGDSPVPCRCRTVCPAQCAAGALCWTQSMHSFPAFMQRAGAADKAAKCLSWATASPGTVEHHTRSLTSSKRSTSSSRSKEHPNPIGALASHSLALGLSQGLPVPASQHSPAAPHCTSRPSLEAGAQRQLPAAGSPSLCCADTCTFQSTVRASWVEEGRESKRDVTGGVGTSPPQAPPPSIWEAMCRGGCPIPDCRVGRSKAGVPPRSHPSSLSKTPSTATTAAPRSFPRSGLKIYPLGQMTLWAAGSRVGVGGPARCPPARAGAEVAAVGGSARTGR